MHSTTQQTRRISSRGFTANSNRQQGGLDRRSSSRSPTARVGVPRFAAESRCGKRRKGTVTVELAVSLPLIFFIIFGSIEACNLIFLKQALTQAAYEGAIEGMKPNATQSEVIQHLQTSLQARNIQGATITAGASGNPIEQVSSGELFSVEVSAQTDLNLISPQLFANFSEIQAEVQARKQ